MKTILEIKQLTKEFHGQAVLNGVDLSIHAGEIFGFVGRNGAGKSTLIHIISDIIHQSSGKITYFEGKKSSLTEVKKSIGVMPDVTDIYGHMKGITFLRYMGNLVGDDRKKVDYIQLLKDVGLVGAENKKIKSYSFGMKKKLCIAQALLGNPSLIILDEPTSGLDPESAIEIRSLILQLKELGKTIFLTSHNLDEIDKISDRVGILSKGKITKLGKPSDLKRDMENKVTLHIRTSPVLTEGKLAQLSNQINQKINYLKTEENFVSIEMDKEEYIPDLSAAIVQENIHLYEIKLHDRAFEDVFLNS